MGADLYREPAHEQMVAALNAKHGVPEGGHGWELGGEARSAYYEEFQEKQRQGDCYFRDSYNESSLLWRLGLSWWRDLDDYLNDDYDLTGEGLTRFRDMIRGRTLDLSGLDQEGKDYFTEKRERFLRFLGRAIEENGRIHCST